VRLSDFPVPDSPAARAALQVATEYLSEALINHSIRSWYWAVGFAAFEERSGFDAELLYTAALLHDIGLAEEFDNHTLAYELAGGHVAWALTAGAGWEKSRRTRAARNLPARDYRGIPASRSRRRVRPLRQ
jgi:HD superfamily phosphodiesterase